MVPQVGIRMRLFLLFLVDVVGQVDGQRQCGIGTDIVWHFLLPSRSFLTFHLSCHSRRSCRSSDFLVRGCVLLLDLAASV